ncbi:hypothetical protein LTR84_000440 [Exophiala bonariae]|uniref:NADPH-dependent diflavin oxidoreductase 1 n=1 Tax=Exophiala bonariae TaxID=1690606 RepID=A0AAV9NRP0_9EURO|nr:hypothetical protein LTR84_000440 [Exophiala bonariae]
MTTDNGQSQDDRSALILFGTETGTSQDIAEEIGRCLERLHFQTDVTGLDNVSLGHLSLYPSCLTVFVVATTGQGDFPDNARKFWKSLLRKKLSPSTLAETNYAVVGLGDSSYPKFNWAARKLDKRLRQLGATSIIESCEADEQGDDSTDGAFLAWLPQFRDVVLNRFPLSPGQVLIPNDVLLPSKWRLSESTSGFSKAQLTQNGSLGGVSSTTSRVTDTFTATLEVNDRVTPADHWQDVRFMTLCTSEQVDYLPGDALSISPRNLPVDVALLIERMAWGPAADVPIHFVSTRSHSGRPLNFLSADPMFSHQNLTLRILLTEYLDINAIPRRSFFGAIANYTSDSMHKERLLEFTDPQYLDEYYDYATRPRRSIIEILQEFDTVQIPWQEAPNIFPTLRPRQFSIASGGDLKWTASGQTKFELLIAIVKYRTVIKRIREGVCTKYLAQLPVGTKLEVSLKTEGRFAKSDDLLGKSHILIGAGTGIAPLRALVHEKIARGHILGDTSLIFGCRNQTADYFFSEEWSAITAQNHTTDATSSAERSSLEVIPAFSRDQKSKVYVQDRIRERSELIWTFLREQAATVIVCGASGQMPKAVRQALVDALVAEGTKRMAKDSGSGHNGGLDDGEGELRDEPIQSQHDAEGYLARLEKEDRYKQETWS